VEPIPATAQVLGELAKHGDTEIVAWVLKMSRIAKRTVPETVGLSLALLKDGLTLTLVASSDQISALDAVQYLDGGPCVEAAHEDRIIAVDRDDILDESRWLMFAQATAAAGVASSLTLPILREGRVVGTINLYAATADAFDGHHQELADALTGSAESIVTNADLSFSTRLAAADAPTKLADADDINIALGVIAASRDVDIPTAQERLRLAAARAGITQAQAARAVSEAIRPGN
jgi:GAF domain-containing protein